MVNTVHFQEYQFQANFSFSTNFPQSFSKVERKVEEVEIEVEVTLTARIFLILRTMSMFFYGFVFVVDISLIFFLFYVKRDKSIKSMIKTEANPF